ncbi:MAG: SDR family oxidoreductase [Spirochaetia bacterium]|jgi:short-subunit dehydrogenase
MEGQITARGAALVTGASRGIGGAIVEALAAEGWEVIAVCRRPDKIPRAQRADGVRYLGLDLSKKRDVDLLVKTVKAVDVLVNNIGASPIGPAEEAPIEKVRELFELNFFTAVRLTQAYLPAMRKRGRGAVIFIGSMKSEAPTPFSSFYSASKAALRSFSECLRMEVKEYGITVSLIAPYMIRTTLPQEKQFAAKSPYAAAVRRVKESRDRLIARAAEPRDVARVVLKILAAARPRVFYTAGQAAGLQAFLARHLPRRIVEANMARRFRLHGPKEEQKP